jgi:cell division FtsZ-interacting protein ZapD
MDSEQLNNQVTEQETGNQPEAASTAWWDALGFEGKEFTTLRPDGTLVLLATAFAPERNLQVLHEETASAIIHALREKFHEVEARVQEVATEWETTEDKSKLASKVARARDYLQHAVAIGDFMPLYQQAARWDQVLQEGFEKAYAARLELIEHAEKLASGEASKDAAQELRDLTDKWKSMPHLDKDRADALWARLEAARNTFHDHRRERNEAEQAELSSNLDLKTEIVDEAEKLAASDDWKHATERFKELMDKWKGIGRTFNEKNEALWQRFVSAKNVFYDRKKHHFEEIQTEQETNYTAKLELVEEAEKLAESSDWGKTSNRYNVLMEKWKKIGRVPLEKADELWTRMSKAKDTFFSAKRQHFATIRVGLDDNYAQKAALVKQAESLQHSSDWRAATDEFSELMEAWKRIGPVAREHSEALWESFLKARRHFFNRKDEDRERRRGQMERAQAGRLSQTKDFLGRLRSELEEDEATLADYHVSLGNLSGGKMDGQIRANLERLIAQAAPRIQKKREKIAEVEAQLNTISRQNSKKKKDEKEESGVGAPLVVARDAEENESEVQETEAAQPSTEVDQPVENAENSAPVDESSDDSDYASDPQG